MFTRVTYGLTNPLQNVWTVYQDGIILGCVFEAPVTSAVCYQHFVVEDYPVRFKTILEAAWWLAGLYYANNNGERNDN